MKVIGRVYTSWSAITDRKVELLTFCDSAVYDFGRWLKDELSRLCIYHRKYDVFLNTQHEILNLRTRNDYVKKAY